MKQLESKDKLLGNLLEYLICLINWYLHAEKHGLKIREGPAVEIKKCGVFFFAVFVAAL